MKKRFFYVVIAILMVLLFVLSACKETDTLEKKIDELQQQIEKFQQQTDESHQQIDELQQQLADLQQAVEAKDSEIEDLNQQIKSQDKRIEELLRELRNELSVTAGLFSLQEAYDRGYLTKEDLEQIAYYINNGLSCPEPLDSSIEDAIKESAAYEIRNRQIEPFLDATADGFTIVRYYGNYSNSFVVRMRNDYDLYPTDVPSYWVEIGGVQFHFIGYDDIVVWIAK